MPINLSVEPKEVAPVILLSAVVCEPSLNLYLSNELLTVNLFSFSLLVNLLLVAYSKPPLDVVVSSISLTKTFSKFSTSCPARTTIMDSL